MESSSNPPPSSLSLPVIKSGAIEIIADHTIDESSTLFLGDLPSSATAQQIFVLFPEIEVKHVEIKIINISQGSLCYAFVTFATAGNSDDSVLKVNLLSIYSTTMLLSTPLDDMHTHKMVMIPTIYSKCSARY